MENKPLSLTEIESCPVQYVRAVNDTLNAAKENPETSRQSFCEQTLRYDTDQSLTVIDTSTTDRFL